MFTIEQVMAIRSQLINTLNQSGLTLEVALLLIKDVYNELYIAGLQQQLATGGTSKQFTKEETIPVAEMIEEEELKEDESYDKNND